MPKSMPTLFLKCAIHLRSDGLLLRVNVPLRDVHVAMTREIGESPRVHTRRQRVRHVCRSVYSSNELNSESSLRVSSLRIRIASAIALMCCFFSDDGSMGPLFVGAGNTQALAPSSGKRRCTWPAEDASGDWVASRMEHAAARLK
jgi:hypothetical protein